MHDHTPTRGLGIRAAVSGLLAGFLLCAVAQAQRRMGGFVGPMHIGYAQHQRPAPIVREPPVPKSPPQPVAHGPVPPTGGHLAEWMSHHRNLTPAQQQEALTREPGFKELPPATQLRLQTRLGQLNAMTPEQQNRTIAHNEAMERLTPDQRAQVRGAMQQLGALPPEERKTVARAFRQLRDLPPGQRLAAMNSPRYAGQLNAAQQDSLSNLLQIEPMLPPPEKQ